MVKQKTLKNTGQLYILDDLEDGAGMRNSRAFLNQLAREFAKHSTKYMDQVHEASFALGERQISSVLAPAISQITSTFIMEYPLLRSWSKVKHNDKDDKHGWVDYWCRYGSTDFLLELKSNLENLKTKEIRKNLLDNWSYMQKEQLHGLKQEGKNIGEYCSNVVTIG